MLSRGEVARARRRLPRHVPPLRGRLRHRDARAATSARSPSSTASSGSGSLRAIHLNDARKPLGSRVDRHAPIGEGFLGLRDVPAARWRIRGCATCPKVLETPGRARGLAPRAGAVARAGARRGRAARVNPEALPPAPRPWHSRPASTWPASRRPIRRPSWPTSRAWIARGHAGEMTYLTDQAERRSDLRVAFPWARSVLAVGLQYDTPHPYSTEDADQRLDRALRLGRRLPRRAEGPAGHASWHGSRARVGSFQSRDVRGHGSDRGARLCGRRRPRRLGQEHVPAAPRARLLVLPGRGGDRPRPARARHAAAGHVRELHRVPRRLPHRRAARAVRARRDALHQLSDDRAEGRRSPRTGARASGGTSSAATSARTSARGTAGAGITGGARVRAARRAGGARARAAGGARRRGLPRASSASSPVKRAKRRGLLRNVAVALGNSGDPTKRPVLERLAADEDPLVREHARWALRRLERA